MMEAGREMDALVAEKIFGWEWQKHPDRDIRYFRPTDIFRYGAIAEGDLIQYTDQLPYYSTDIAAAWEVVERLKADGWSVEIYTDKDIPARCTLFLFCNPVDDSRQIEIDADTAPHAICLAALKAVEGSTP